MLFEADEREGIKVKHEPRAGTYFEVADGQIVFRLWEKLK
jgi:hypothetical protein